MDDFLQHFADEYDDDNYPVDAFPTGDEPFGPFFVDGYPEWLAQSMLTWLPREFVDEYRESAVGSDGYIPAKAAEIIANGLRKRGCTVEPSPVFLI